MDKFQWTLMVGYLQGARLENFECHKVAQMSCGEVRESHQHLKLTQRLYTPTAMERFAFNTIGPKVAV